jgi:hypothetical protein
MLLRNSCIVFLLDRGSQPSQLVVNSLSNPSPAETVPTADILPFILSTVRIVLLVSPVKVIHYLR